MNLPGLFSKTTGISFFQQTKKTAEESVTEVIETAKIAKEEDDKAKKLSKSRIAFESMREKKAAEAALLYFGMYDVPIHLLKAPLAKMAVRDFHRAHAKFVAREMFRLGTNFPIKPSIVICFEVVSEILLTFRSTLG